MAKLISKNDRVFIAGHQGMVGSAVCRALKKQGYKNLVTASRINLNLNDASGVQEWFSQYQPNVVILAAAKVGGIFANKSFPADFLLENLKIQNNVIESAWKSNVKRLLFLGSSCIYPKNAEQPIREESLLTGELEITNESYAIAKISGLKLCESLRRQYGFDAITLMPTNLYGPQDNYHPKNSHVLAALVRKFYEAKVSDAACVTCWGTGLPMREFLHVEDLAEACLFALEQWQPKSGELPYLNVGTGIDLTIRDLAKLIAKKLDFKGKILWDTTKPDGTARKQLDVSRINSLGWKSRISLSDGLEETLSLYAKLASTQNYD